MRATTLREAAPCPQPPPGRYCKFTVEGNVNHYRAVISVLDPATDTTVVALPTE
jgi:hypothetical protein